jgi:hypothetical protein
MSFCSLSIFHDKKEEKVTRIEHALLLHRLQTTCATDWSGKNVILG